MGIFQDVTMDMVEVHLIDSSTSSTRGPVTMLRYQPYFLSVVVLSFSNTWCMCYEWSVQLVKAVNEVYHMYNRHQYPCVILNVITARGMHFFHFADVI